MRCTIYYTIIHPNGIIIVNFYSCSMKDEYVLFTFSDNLFALSHICSVKMIMNSPIEFGFPDRYRSL